MFRNVYEVLHKNLDPKSIQAVLIIAGYQYKACFCRRPRNQYGRLSNRGNANCKFK